jgi:hypothetical protein
MIRTSLICFTLAFAVSGCASPVIYDLESDKVMVQATGDDAATRHTADEGCTIHGRKAVGPLSQRCLDGYCINKVYLFACKSS